ncbi:hypothetical protein [Phytohabitans aurantiacus]|uniref:Uncharacterized protein n=1 Tax=Phytohabitans aurantiacus TaxID=3016789 RepID=A0ABQ5R704_9ACTN|nr:hypothetical protein [Phytohabitans aurantiacus]GLI02333.1 hypothetical protein Pa4123_76110 [Phytohabitans aurantiacus]
MLLGLDRADKVASVFSFYIALSSLVVAIGVAIASRRFPHIGSGRIAGTKTEESVEHIVNGKVSEAQREWVATRRVLNGQRGHLAHAGAALYGSRLELADTGLITAPAWIPGRPLDLSSITLTYRKRAPAPLISGAESESVHARPPVSSSRWYPKYTYAMMDLDRPQRFESRFSWRLLDVGPGARDLAFGPTSYFEALDVCEAVAHETARAYFHPSGARRTSTPRLVRSEIRRTPQNSSSIDAIPERLPSRETFSR